MRTLKLVTAALLVAALAALAAPAGDSFAAAPRCNGKPATQFLTSPDTIDGLGGDDLICGRDGDDSINPGPGNDTVYGGRGDDLIDLMATTDDAGNDTYYGDRGNDYIFDGDGVNTAYGGGGADSIYIMGKGYGESGDDPTIVVTESSLNLHDGLASGGSGSDGADKGVVVLGGVADGGSGNDVVVADGDGDTLVGSSGSDMLNSRGSNQTLDCGSAYDSYTADPTDTVLPNCENAG